MLLQGGGVIIIGAIVTFINTQIHDNQAYTVRLARDLNLSRNVLPSGVAGSFLELTCDLPCLAGCEIAARFEPFLERFSIAPLKQVSPCCEKFHGTLFAEFAIAGRRIRD